MAAFSPRPNLRNDLHIHLLSEAATPKPRLVSVPNKQPRQPKFPTSSKNIMSPPSLPRSRRRMSTQVIHRHSLEHTFLEEFVKQVSEQKKQINVIRKENLKENLKHQQQQQQPQVVSFDKPVMDIVDWIKMKVPMAEIGLGTMEFNREHDALERLINRNQQAIQSLVQNRKQLMEICMTKQLKKLS